MEFVKANIRTELKRAAKGKPTKLPFSVLAECALRYYPRPEKQDSNAADVEFLERLYRLEDPREG